MRSITKYTGVAVLLLSGVLLAGCVGGTANGADDVNGVDTKLTLEGAKSTAMAMERELAAMVPVGVVTTIEQHPTGVLLSCQGDRAYQWSGRTNVLVSSAPDGHALVNAIVARYLKTEGYTAKRETTVDGQPSAKVIGSHGAGYLVSPSVDLTAIEILSFSPCFILPKDMSSDGTY